MTKKTLVATALVAAMAASASAQALGPIVDAVKEATKIGCVSAGGYVSTGAGNAALSVQNCAN